MLPTLPGLTEAVEDAAHWLREGHTVHDEDPVDGHEPGAEHGCSGLQHLCRCCPASHLMLAVPAVTSPALEASVANGAWPTTAALDAETQAPPLRPPIA